MITPYYDEEFLLKLDKVREKEIYARITSLTQEENPVEYIEGRIVSGSINIDGTSTIRRTCSLSMVADNLNIKDYYWGLNTKFSLEIGVKNTIDSNYSDIVWFPQGLYIFTSFNTSLSVSSYTINLSGKDKMCLLNGDLSGNLPHSVDFGVEEYYDKNTKMTTYTKIPIKQIIREALHTYGNEPYHNIIINDVDDYGVELLEYRGDTPIYMFRSDLGYENMTMNGEMQCYVDGSTSSVNINSLSEDQYDNLVDLVKSAEATYNPGVKIKLDKDGKEYTIAKIDFGETAGYRLTPLTYPDELICNAGEPLTSMLDKIKAMLGDYEYFYDLDGRFVFQRTKTYLSNPWNSIVKLEDKNDMYVESAAYTSALSYAFHDSYYFSQVANNPQLTNVKNDFSIWGTRKGITGAEIPVNMRYALDYKPTEYVNYSGERFTYPEYDWREIIYQMAKDYFKHNQEDEFLTTIANNNRILYPTGYTGYERYYTDIYGFWRQLYKIPETITEVFGSAKEDLPDPTYKYYTKTVDEKTKNVVFTSIDFNSIARVKQPDSNIQYYYRENGQMYKAEFPLSNFITDREYFIKEDNDIFSSINIYEYIDNQKEHYILYDYENYNDNFWHKNVNDNPNLLNFWFDFIGEGSSIEKFFISAIGDRIKVVNDNQITGIYFKEVPTVIFITTDEWNAMAGQPTQTGYTYIRINSSLDGFFNISSQGKSAHDEMENLIYNHTYAADTVTLTSTPIYYLQPNTRISIKDVGANVEGEYIITRISLPLSYNGMMQITAAKVAETIY